MDKLFRQSFWLLTAQGLSKLLSFFYVLYLANTLGVSSFGIYIVALSYFSLVSAISDFGVSRYLTREIAINKSAKDLVFSAISIRFISLSLFIIIFSLALFIFDKDITRRDLIILALLAVLPQSISLTLDAVFIALLKVKYAALGIIVLSISTVVLGLTFLNLGFGLVGVVSGLILGQAAYCALMIILSFQEEVRFFTKIRLKVILNVIKESMPYWLLGILGIFYFKVDSVILSYLKGSFDTGIYGAGYKFLEALAFIPAALSTVMFPVFAKKISSSADSVYSLYLRMTAIFLIISIVIMAFYLLFLPSIIYTFLPQYLPSIHVVNILSLTIPFFFMIAPQSTLLLSTQRFLRSIVFISIFNLVLNIILNLIFVPKYSYIASAWITVFSDVIGFLIFFVFITIYFRKDYGTV